MNPKRAKREPRRIKFTQLAVERIRPHDTNRLIYWDTILTSFGLRVSPKGRKSWLVVHRVGGKQIWKTLGTLPRIPKLADARELARQTFEGAHREVNGVSELLPKAHAPIPVETCGVINEGPKGHGVTFVEGVARYLNDAENGPEPNRASTLREMKSRLNRAKESWKDKLIGEITKDDVDTLIESVKIGPRRKRSRDGKTSGAVGQAYFELAALKTLFRWAVREDLVLIDPTEKARKVEKPRQRKRLLTDDEIRVFWRACDQIGYPFGTVLQLLLLTAQRKSEVAGLPWHELDRKEGEWIWMLPGERAKNKQDHVVPLSGYVVDIMKSLPNNQSGFLFSEDSEGPIEHFQTIKEEVDSLMSAELDYILSDHGHWVIHDLRRTAATGMRRRLKVSREVVKKILNHTKKDVTDIYDLDDLLEEKTAALEKWGYYIRNLVK
jgi:integrase